MTLKAISNLATRAFQEAPTAGLLKSSPDLIVARDKAGEIWAFWQPPVWSQNFIATLGEANFVAVLPTLENPGIYARAVVHCAPTKSGGVRVIAFAITARAAAELEKEKPKRRVPVEIDDAREFPSSYGRKSARPGRARTEALANAA